MALIPLGIHRSEKTEPKPLYVCPGCSNHTYRGFGSAFSDRDITLRYLHPKERRRALAGEAILFVGKRIFLFVLPDLI
jgi:hypothetical protein